ncbi:hypothetical protein GCM10027060_24700 [Nesterenkonia halophila]
MARLLVVLDMAATLLMTEGNRKHLTFGQDLRYYRRRRDLVSGFRGRGGRAPAAYQAEEEPEARSASDRMGRRH